MSKIAALKARRSGNEQLWHISFVSVIAAKNRASVNNVKHALPYDIRECMFSFKYINLKLCYLCVGLPPRGGRRCIGLPGRRLAAVLRPGRAACAAGFLRAGAVRGFSIVGRALAAPDANVIT